ncbi:MAG: 4Fe-4S binding protein, partial [Deltaproteobacteria bacterium]|nr:4Fe-4S binding protein [Deltaproteobacteria bacterium]
DAADHFAAAIGAMVTGALLIPLLGTAAACLVLAMVAASPVALIVAEFIFRRIDPSLAGFHPRTAASFPFIRLSWFLAFSVAAAFVWNLLIGPPGSPPLVQFSEEVLKSVSGSEAFEFKRDPYPHYVGTSPGETGFTVTLSTMPTAGTVSGYGGPINVLLSVSDRGIIRGVSVVESRETPTYIKGMEKWLERLRGLSILSPMDSEVDAMTGATISSRAVLAALQVTGKKIAGPLLNMPEVAEAGPREGMARDLLTDVRIWSIALLMIIFVYAFYSRSRRVRLVCLLASLIALGVYLNAPFSTLEAASLLRGEIPAPGTVWRNALFVAVILMSVLWGQAFCGFLCPFGALQELLSVRKFRLRASATVEKAGRYCKFVVLGALLSLFLVTDDPLWFSFDPLQHFFANRTWDFFLGRMDNWILGLCLAALLTSIFYFRFWCRYLCPAGAFLALSNKIALLREHAPKPIPGRCDLGVTSTSDVDCIRCHRCLHG